MRNLSQIDQHEFDKKCPFNIVSIIQCSLISNTVNYHQNQKRQIVLNE